MKKYLFGAALILVVALPITALMGQSGQFNIVLGANRVVGEVIHLDDSHRVAHARAGFIRGSEAVYINGLRMCRGKHYRVDSRPGHITLFRDGQHGDLIIIDYTQR